MASPGDRTPPCSRNFPMLTLPIRREVNSAKKSALIITATLRQGHASDHAQASRPLRTEAVSAAFFDVPSAAAGRDPLRATTCTHVRISCAADHQGEEATRNPNCYSGVPHRNL